MERSIQEFAAVCFFIVGMSHILQPRAWVHFFVLLRGLGEPGSFVNALLTLPMGVGIVVFHNVWRGIPTVLTLLGWAYVLKSLLYLVYPLAGVRSLSRVSVETANRFVAVGVVLVGLSGPLALSLIKR
jgi:hypothetical protein